MKTLGNLIWLVFNGIWLAIGYGFVGLLLCIPIVTIPFAKQLFKIAGYALWPFGRTLVKGSGANAGSAIGNVLWLIVGVFLALGHLLAAAANLFLCIFIVTIPICLPFAIANLKLTSVALWPFGREVVDASTLTVVPPGMVVVPDPARTTK